MTTVSAGPIQRQRIEEPPPAFRGLAGRLEQMSPGAPGKVGVLELEFEARGGKTQLVRQYATGPLRVNRVLYLDEALPDMAFVLVQSVSGGILQGDRMTVKLRVGPGARAHVTTQSAVKVYRMEADYATQHVHVSVAEGACLELINDYVIPYRGARFYSEAKFTVDPGATMIYADGVAPGRVASGEAFEYELLQFTLQATSTTGRLRAVDSMIFAPGRDRLGRPGLLGPYSDVGSLLVLAGTDAGAELPARMTAAIGAGEGGWGGASALPYEDGAFARVLGHSSGAVQAALHRAWDAARKELLGVGTPPVHRAKYGFDPV